MTHDELRKLAEQATPGPWRFDGEVVASDRGVVTRSPRITEPCAPGGMNDAIFIAATSPDVVIGLLDALAEAQDLAVSRGEQIVRMREEIAQLRTELDATASELTVQRDRAKRAEMERDALRAHAQKAVPRG